MTKPSFDEESNDIYREFNQNKCPGFTILHHIYGRVRNIEIRFELLKFICIEISK